MAFLRNENGDLIRKDGSLVPRIVRPKGPRKTVLDGGRRVSHMKVDRILGGTGPLREEYERLLENPNTLLKDLVAWFKERGHHVNITAVRVHRKRHLEQFQDVRQVARMAAAFNELVRSTPGGAGTIVEASQGAFEMAAMQRLFEMKKNPAGDPEQFQRWARMLRDATTSRRTVEQIRDQHDRKAAEALKQGAAAAGQGATGKDVVMRMREILGV